MSEQGRRGSATGPVTPSGTRTVLVVAAAPDRRASSRTLVDVVAELRARPGTQVALWHLRDGGGPADVGSDDGSGDATDRVVDHLRTWTPATVVDRALGTAMGNRLRSLRLRRWLRALAPDVVLLDDGLGERILGTLPRGVVRVARANDTPPDTVGLEDGRTPSMDLWLVGPGAEAPAGWTGPTLAARPVRDLAAARQLATSDTQARLRAEAGVAPDVALVVGRGAGWLDGDDVFPRLLWALADRHGLEAHGLWVTPTLETDHADRLRAEAERCGLGDRYHLVAGGPDLWTCGDVAVLPYRDHAEDPNEPTARLPMVLRAVAAGLPVVAFAAAGTMPDPAVTVVPDLDVEALAAAVAAAFRAPQSRADRVAAAHQRLDVGPWTDELLAAVDRIAPR